MQREQNGEGEKANKGECSGGVRKQCSKGEPISGSKSGEYLKVQKSQKHKADKRNIISVIII